MFLQKEIFTECKKIDLPLTGKGKVYNFHPDRFNPGQPHTFELECDIIAPIKYLFPQQYRGLNVNIMKTDLHRELLEKVKLDMLEKHRNFIPVANQEKRLALDDGAMITFEGYTIDANGEKGQKIPQINQGQMSRILMQKGRLMQGLLEGLLGAKSGENRVIKVKFEPKQNGGDQRIVEGGIYSTRCYLFKKHVNLPVT
jgi:FKBP-type peptidyl-prolyl cis-trans isomerase (trigger factor)